ncbi:hypothetical protein F5Y12DRAFT_712330 [Xylaria sp. FL1777]|nr:hypothetical protein F5Y12DRAFT_712330 [Xylaria sp. FL1777]
MVLTSNHGQSFVQDLWAKALSQLDSHTNIIEIAVDDFNLLGQDGEMFFKNQLRHVYFSFHPVYDPYHQVNTPPLITYKTLTTILPIAYDIVSHITHEAIDSTISNNVVEFFTDTTNSSRIYLASPMSLLQMNFTIHMTGERLQAVTPLPSIQVDQECNALIYDVQYMEPVIQQPEIGPDTMYLNPIPRPIYYTDGWAPMPAQQSAAVPFDQPTQTVWPPEAVSPTPNGASYNDPVLFYAQSYEQAQHVPFYAKSYEQTQHVPFYAQSHEQAQHVPFYAQSYEHAQHVPFYAQSYEHAQHVPSQPALTPMNFESSIQQNYRTDNSVPGDFIAVQPTPNRQSLDKKIPRPTNAFMLYRRDHCHQVKQEEKGIPNQKVSIILGKRWKALSEEEQKPWRDQADRIAEEHKRMYPDWKYRPGPKKVRRRAQN